MKVNCYLMAEQKNYRDNTFFLSLQQGQCLKRKIITLTGTVEKLL